VVVGTTGESPTVDVDEHKELIRVAVQHSHGRIPVIAGTRQFDRRGDRADRVGKKSGRDRMPVGGAYYNKPTQEGQYRHFRKIAETVDLPMILYNVPARTVADLQNDTVMRLAQVRASSASRTRPPTSSAAPTSSSARRAISRSTAARMPRRSR